jgi:RimJ/RimL family protein N-acetyltransferase
LKIIAQPKEWIGQMVSHVQGQPIPWGNFTALALVSDEGYFKAGVVYNNFEHANVCGHIAIWPGARLTPSFLRAMFDYPFNQLDKERITALVARKNRKAMKFVQKLGFKYEGCLRKYFGREDMMLYGMLRGECQFLPAKEPVRRVA